MIITYHGHSTFKLKGKRGTVVTDPYESYIGFSLPSLSADLVTVSHQHRDHNAVTAVSGTARHEKPFVISHPGEYEVDGISVFGVQTFHDDQGGVERGQNTVFTILIDGIRVCHLGDLGHELTAEQAERIGSVDVLLCPVGGTLTINPVQAIKVIRSLEPAVVIPMHFRTDQHDEQVFGDLSMLQDFLKEYGLQPEPQGKLQLEKESLPEETELVVLVH